MLKIKEINILNYRSCIKTKVEMLTDLTVLIGANGVGKSNILNCFQLLKRINKNKYFLEKSNILENLSNTQLDIIFNKSDATYSLRAKIYYDTNELNVEEIYISEIKIKDLAKKNSNWIDIDSDLYEFMDYFDRRNSKVDLTKIQIKGDKNKELNIDMLEIILYLRKISYYSATQFSDPTKCPISLELDDSRLIRPLGMKKSKNHEQFIYDLYKTSKNNDRAFMKYINTVNQNGIGLIDDIVFFDHKIPSSSFRVKAGGVIEKMERIKNIIVPSVIIDGLNLTPNQLSEGTFKTLALIFYILNDESELLLIEEPEVCVHHGLLSSIIELIKSQSKHKQILISTHSDYVLDKMAPENIVLVKKNKSTGTVASTLSKSLSRNDFKALKEYLKDSGNLGEYWKEGGFEHE